jgi:hypothetical protein
MYIPIIPAWQNIQIKVQRQPANPGVNVLNEPNLGSDSTWPVVNDPYGHTTHSVRIEFNQENAQYLPTGERIVQQQTLMFVDPNDDILPQDRITIVSSDIHTDLPSFFIVQDIWPEYNAVGDVNHYMAELQPH